MTFLIDEDVPAEIDRSLQQAGHKSIRVAEVLGYGTDDVDVWEYACRTGIILVTCNRQDFLALAGDVPATGLVVLIRRRSRLAECAHLIKLIEAAGDAALQNNINFA